MAATWVPKLCIYIYHQLSVHDFLDSRCKMCCDSPPPQERDPQTHDRCLVKHPKGRETRATVSWPVAVTTVKLLAVAAF